MSPADADTTAALEAWCADSPADFLHRAQRQRGTFVCLEEDGPHWIWDGAQWVLGPKHFEAMVRELNKTRGPFEFWYDALVYWLDHPAVQAWYENFGEPPPAPAADVLRDLRTQILRP